MMADPKIVLFVLLWASYMGGFIQVSGQFEQSDMHDVEFEFTPMDPRDYPEPPLNDEDVMPLSNANFNREIRKASMIIIMFWKEDCQKCQKLRPEFGKAATAMSKENTAVSLVFASLNCGDEGRKVCNKYDIKHLPAVKMFREGEFVKNYVGAGSEHAFHGFARKEMNPGPKTLETRGDFDVFTDTDDVQVVGFFGMFPANLKEAFLVSVDRLGQVVQFGIVEDPDLMRDFREWENRLVLFRPKLLESPHEEQVVVYDGPSQRVNITKWIMDSYHGLMGLRYEHNQHQFPAPVVHIYWNHDFDLNSKTSHYWRNRFMEQAKHFKGKIRFSLSLVTDYEEELTHFGLMSENHIPDPDKPMVAAWDKFGMKFVMREDFTFPGLRAWLTQLVEGELKPYLLTEDPPLDKWEDEVKVVVAKTWEVEVAKVERDVFVAFHAPWCQHCQMLMPVLGRLAKTLGAEEVDIVKYDATANDAPKYFKVEGFPSIFFLRKNDKTRPLLYNAARTHSTMLKFIAELATDPLRSFDRKGFSQAFLGKDGAPDYTDKIDRLKKNKKEGFSVGDRSREEL